jgi:hypothetical protein
MSAIGVQSQINKDRALWLSTIPTDVIHGNVICDTILANAGYISTLFTDNLNVSTLNASTLGVKTLDVSGMYVSTIRGNTAFFSSMTLASDLSGGLGYVRFSVDASGIQVDGDPIRFDNLVYLTSTINIIQVSTLVDTDIFASNGYFSTLSSGTLSTGQLQVQQGLFSSLQGDYGSFNRLFVSSLEALDISGVESSNWSQYPTLASSIIFQPAFILSNVGNKLYFAGQELTDASGGGIDWSYFDAQTDVSMNNFSLRGVSTLQYQDGARLYSQTGNDLFYNGQPVQYGAVSNVSQWANYPAVNTIQTGGFPISSIGNLTVTANSNIRFLADGISTVADNGIDIGTASRIDLTAQNGFQGQINLTANPGYQGLYGQIAMTANGGTVAGVGTGGLVSITANTPLGTLCNATSAIKLSASGVNSYAGAIPSIGSLAGYNFIYGTGGVNICAGLPAALPNVPLTTFLYGTAGVTVGSDLYAPNIFPYWNGLTTPPDMLISGRYIIPNLAQVYVNLSNVKSLYMDGTAQIQNANYVSTVSTVGQNANFNTGTYGTLAAGAVGASAGLFTTLEAGSISTSLVTAPLLSTININLSTINGIDWQDISGSVYTTTSSFSTLFTSTLSGYGGFPIEITSPLFFSGPDAIDNLAVINTTPDSVPILQIGASTMILATNNVLTTSLSTTRLQTSSLLTSSFLSKTLASDFMNTSSLLVSTIGGNQGGFPVKVVGTLAFATPNSIENVLNINTDQTLNVSIFADRFSVAAFNTTIGSLSTTNIQASNIKVSTLQAVGTTIDVSGSLEVTGGMFLNETLELPLATGGINFDDGSGSNYTRLMRRDVASANMLSVVNTPGLSSNNMMPLGVGELFLTGGADQYAACRLYSVFPYGNYELDAIDENGTFLHAYLQGYYNPFGLNPGYTQAFSNVSSISGYDESSAPNQMVNIINGLTTSNLIISSINGAAYPPGGGAVTDQFSTLYVSSLNFSSAVSYTSNTSFNYPLFIEHDAAGATSNSGAAIVVKGHNYSVGAVVQQIEMGWRTTGENYILSYWPGQNLEDLNIESSQLQITNGVQSSFMNFAGHALQTGNDILVGTTQIAPESISTLDFSVSSINGVVFPPLPIYCEFTTTSTITVTGANTPTVIPLDTTNHLSGIDLDAGDVEILTAGTYLYTFNVQLDKTGAGVDICDLWLRINASDVGGTGSRISIQGNTGQCLAVCSFILTLNAADKVALVFASADTTMAATYFPAWSTPGDPYDRPDIPAVIVTVQKIA